MTAGVGWPEAIPSRSPEAWEALEARVPQEPAEEFSISEVRVCHSLGRRSLETSQPAAPAGPGVMAEMRLEAMVVPWTGRLQRTAELPKGAPVAKGVVEG